MCGLFAAFAKQNTITTDYLHRATCTLKHRGPDSDGLWLAADGRVGLGHTRLQIIGSYGPQPLASEDGRCHAIVNGEIYNYRPLKAALEARGHRFTTQSDSEVIVHLYEEEGIDCVKRLRGQFAFVLWDNSRQTLYAARDRFGLKPLFYSAHNGLLTLASEAKALFAAGVPAAWDHESVFQNLFLCFDPRRSFFKGVAQLPPGHWLSATTTSTRLVSYWQLNFPPRRQQNNTHDHTAVIEEVRTHLDEAVKLRLQADLPVGCLLSGGLDSSAVLGLAAKHSDQPIAAFTIAFDHSDFDESQPAAVSAAHSHAAHHIIPVSEADFADCMAEAIWHGEMLQLNAHGTARFILSREIQKAGYKSVLAGEGADELFAGYRFLQRAASREQQRPTWPQRLGRLFQPPTAAEQTMRAVSPWLGRGVRLLGIPDTILDYVGGGLGQIRALLAPDFLAEFKGYDPYLRFLWGLQERNELIGRAPDKQIIHIWLRSVFINYHLAADRLDMAHGVEVRLPFLDHELFEFVRNLPIGLLAFEGVNKYLLREAARPVIAAPVYSGRKQPFFAPPTALRIGNPLYNLMQETLRGPALAAVPFFQQAAVIALLDRLPTLPEQHRAILDPLLWQLTSFALLQQTLIDN